jgi:hypothetical protein
VHGGGGVKGIFNSGLLCCLSDAGGLWQRGYVPMATPLRLWACMLPDTSRSPAKPRVPDALRHTSTWDPSSPILIDPSSRCIMYVKQVR